MKKWIITTLFVLCAVSIFPQQEITRIGVVDTGKIYSRYYEDSKALRDLQEFKESILEESSSIQDEINDLKSRKVDADRQAKREEAIRLEGQILAKENFLREYQRVKNLEYRSRRTKVELESAFLTEVADAIAFVAISDGFSIVMEKQNSIFLYYTVESDLTDRVLEYLFEKAGKTYTPSD